MKPRPPKVHVWRSTYGWYATGFRLRREGDYHSGVFVSHTFLGRTKREAQRAAAQWARS